MNFWILEKGGGDIRQELLVIGVRHLFAIDDNEIAHEALKFRGRFGMVLVGSSAFLHSRK